ncbi:hypothetical protein NEBULOUS_36 [Microbacterium phage Nebulous]|nr:hypothetical protein NEBULOUS_36 [Microbacterium phage Nebulous]
MRNSKAQCGHFTRKHFYRVHNSLAGRVVIMKCQWTLCQKPLAISHDALLELVAR